MVEAVSTKEFVRWGHTTLKWAVQMRNFSLTKCLLEHTMAKLCGLGPALSICQFSEKADFLLARGSHVNLKQDIAKKISAVCKKTFCILASLHICSKERINCTSSMLQLFGKYGHSMKVPHMSEPIDWV